MQLMANGDLNDQLRQLALEAMITLAETSPAILKKQPKVIHSLGSSIELFISTFYCLYFLSVRCY